MKKHSWQPFSLRSRFMMATAAVVLTLSLAYGLVAAVGYTVNFDKSSYQLLRGESNLFFSLAQWRNNQLTINIPSNLNLNSPTLVFIYDDRGELLWSLRSLPEIESQINKSWLKRNKSGFYELNTEIKISSEASRNNAKAQNKLNNYQDTSTDALTHSVAINFYSATSRLPALNIVVIDSIPQELQRSDVVWEWFGYVLIANLLLVVPLLWLAAYWSLRPIKVLIHQVAELETYERESLNENPPRELRGLVRNLNILLHSERSRYNRYRTTLADLTHSLKTPLAVLQSTLRSMRSCKQMTIEQAEPIMLEQISRISQQIGYYLHRATLRSEHNTSICEVHSVPALLDSLCSALNKVYQRKGVVLTLDISPEITFIGERNDFMEILGNVIDNACKYCLEFVEISAVYTEKKLMILVEDDGPGILESKREIIFQRGQRADTLRPGQGLGLSLASEIIEQYNGEIIPGEGSLGGASMSIYFGMQHDVN